jgi:hypothetical protein
MSPEKVLGVLRSVEHDKRILQEVFEELHEHFTTTGNHDTLELIMSPENFALFKGYESAESDSSRRNVWHQQERVPLVDISGHSSLEMSDRYHETHEIPASNSIELPFLEDDDDVTYLGSRQVNVVDAVESNPAEEVPLPLSQSFGPRQSHHHIDRHPRSPLHNGRTTPQFGKFLELPLELRKGVYEMALCTRKETRPVLCDHKHDGSIKFHDDNQHSRLWPNHNAIYNLLGVTRASKQIRKESLPCFYSANTFAIAEDTATYFAHLEHLGRFCMIRHVCLSIPLLTERWAAQILEQMNTYVNDAEKYERGHTSNVGFFARVKGLLSNMPIRNHYTYLVEHPRYFAGGLSEMALFICLRMLTSAISSIGPGGYTSSITMPIPSIASFTSYPRLRWFSLVCHGLGIHLRYVEGHELVQNQIRSIQLDWHQRFQKKEFAEGEGTGKVDVDVRQRTLEMYPDVDERAFKQEGRAYMRKSCDGDSYRWYKVMHYGGKKSGRVD